MRQKELASSPTLLSGAKSPHPKPRNDTRALSYPGDGTLSFGAWVSLLRKQGMRNLC